jgi:Fe(3+) dicitrate transport protein
MYRRLVIFFLFISVICYSQQVSVKGLLYDEATGKAVSNASVVCAHEVTETDSNGYFFISVPSRDQARIVVSHPSYKTFSRNFKAQEDIELVLFANAHTVNLTEVTVKAGKENSFGISRLNNVEGTTIYAGKKSEAIYVGDLNANLAANNSRQIFSKVPGINVFENEGSGATIGVGGRGLNPNRISNFNTRQNGYDISADALGYPESYYTPPTEAIERIEVLRGAAGLQFGTQFGGMINYRFTEAPLHKKMAGNFRQTLGSFGFFNSFNQISGTVGKYSYNTFYNYKHYDGWRDRSVLNSHNAFGSVKYQVSDKLLLKGEYTFLNSLAQQPGGLTDKQFAQDAAFVNRHRNWFKVNWNLAALTAEYKASDHTRFSATAFGLKAGRDALGVLGRADRADDTTTNRNLLSDQYRNYGAEARMLHRYELLNNNSHLLIGARYYRGQTIRNQGDADKTAAPDFEFLNPENLENSAYEFPSRNCALFAENIFQLTKNLSITPGLRYEYINTASEGYYRVVYRDLAQNIIPGSEQIIADNRSNSRSFLLAGLGIQHKLPKGMEVYANFSQNYRSINFSDMRVANVNFMVDPNLKDEDGFTVDGGFRGAIRDVLYFDAGLFLLKYNNRIGTELKVDSATYHIYRFRTNLGNSRNIGAELFGELDWLKIFNRGTKHKLSTFVNLALLNAVYTGEKSPYSGNTVEFVPDIIFRTGVTYAFRNFGFTCQYSFTDDQFSDATNAPTSPGGTYGLIPAYSVVDFSANYTWKKFGVFAGVNNLANSKYFTRRAEGYPGPGILPADPLNVYFTLQVKL